MNGKHVVVIGLSAIVVLIAMLTILSRPDEDTGSGSPLLVYCAAGIKPPVLELAREFEEKYGTPIQLQYGGSGTLLSNVEVSQRGDLYIAGDRSYIDIASERGLIDEVFPLAYLRPVIAVSRGNPKGINGIGDLLQEGIRIALGNPDTASIGKQTKKFLTQAGLWEQIRKQTESSGVFKPTVPEVANDIQLGAVAQYDELESIRDPVFSSAVMEISIAVTRSTRQPQKALRFARWLNSRVGNKVFNQYGFESVEGDVWELRPEITFFCGAVNRRAVDSIIKAFAGREGVVINTVYNGCGILTGQMRTIRQDQKGAGFPDVYMACDRYYLENVKEWFQEDVDISDTDIVIAVPKGNPKNIESLGDLAKPGMRVSVGQPEQCTIGALTRQLLSKTNVHDAVMKNVVMQTASSAMLIPTVTTKSVDATLAYLTDTVAESDKVDAILINSEHAKAIQPFSIARSSEYKYLGRRLLKRITESKESFSSAGFNVRTE
ncbi:MAG: substrate-binding domain-containing protein [Planctomycetota bacterium]|jgi:molybdenum ABC transporter molybdate-binding protein